jgi:hypothetical protein
MKNIKKVLITKYAVSSGVDVKEVELSDEFPTMVTEASGCFRQSFHGDDWHETKASAIDEVNKRFASKRKSLEKQLALLDKRKARALKNIEEAEL